MLIDRQGHRKYLTPNERRAFIVAAASTPSEVETFALILAHTGVRISEALAITPMRIDLAAQTLVVECLKKRRRGVFRAIPLSEALLDRLEATHHLREMRADAQQRNIRLWGWSRTTAWSRIKEIMAAAGIQPEVRKPKALRHAFGIHGTIVGVSLTLIARWLGHADITTTAIYTEAFGPEERSFAERMWG
ncbi:MAG: site-specific integrase [Rhodospirillaceae bacterium]|nr:MAG: site-specific integrase [Rhodospirillaceae bacterium]